MAARMARKLDPDPWRLGVLPVLCLQTPALERRWQYVLDAHCDERSQSSPLDSCWRQGGLACHQADARSLRGRAPCAAKASASAVQRAHQFAAVMRHGRTSKESMDAWEHGCAAPVANVFVRSIKAKREWRLGTWHPSP